MFHCNYPSGRRYRGYTLLELMIVLAIMVSVMAVSWPRIARRMQLVGPREAALQLKADLAETREQAIASGEAWTLRIQRGSSEYEFGPVSALCDEVDSEVVPQDPSVAELEGELTTELEPTAVASSEETAASPLASADIEQTTVRRDDLPSGMVFDDGFAHSASDPNKTRFDNLAVQPLPNNPPKQLGIDASPFETVDTQWKFAVVFQPDGRATESEIRLKEQASDNKIRLRVRGLTGGVTIDKLERKKRENEQPEHRGETAFPTDLPITNGQAKELALPEVLNEVQ